MNQRIKRISLLLFDRIERSASKRKLLKLWRRCGKRPISGMTSRKRGLWLYCCQLCSYLFEKKIRRNGFKTSKTNWIRSSGKKSGWHFSGRLRGNDGLVFRVPGRRVRVRHRSPPMHPPRKRRDEGQVQRSLRRRRRRGKENK